MTEVRIFCKHVKKGKRGKVMCLWWMSQGLHVYPAMLSYNIDGFEMLSS